MARFTLIAAACIGVLCTEVWSDTITMKEAAYVKGPTVRVGDVADVKGEDAEFLKTIEITPAAVPGGSRRIDAALIRSKVMQAAGESAKVDVTGARRTTATTMSLEISPGMIAEELRQFIYREMPWEVEPTVVEVIPAARRYTVADGEVDFRWQPNPQYAYLGMGTFRGEILVDGKSETTFFAKANIETYDNVIVASQGISRGDTIHSGNTRMEMRALSAVKNGAYFSLLDLEGMVSKSTILAGQVVTPRKVAHKKIVKRGQLIAVETTIGAMTIRSEAQAMSDAAVGDVLTCRNVKSKQELVGTVRKDGVLVVD